MKRSKHSKRKHLRRSHGKRNPAFLLPLVLPVIAVGGVGVILATTLGKTAVAPYINTPAVLGGSVGALAAGIAKQPTGVLASASVVGYLGGLMIGHALQKAADKKAAEKVKSEEGVTSTAEAEKIVEWRKWCKEHNWIATVTPQCYYYAP